LGIDGFLPIRATDQAHAKALDRLLIIVIIVSIVSDIIRPDKAGNGAPKPIRV
jgi:hypothetical protein